MLKAAQREVQRVAEMEDSRPEQFVRSNRQ
jgi:hypothetical protein